MKPETLVLDANLEQHDFHESVLRTSPRPIHLRGVWAYVVILLLIPAVAYAAYYDGVISGSQNFANTSNILDENYGTYSAASGADPSSCPEEATLETAGSPPIQWKFCRLSLGGVNYDFNAWIELSNTDYANQPQSAGITFESGGSGASVSSMVFTRIRGNPFGSDDWTHQGTLTYSGFFPDAYASYTVPGNGVWCMPTWPYACFSYGGRILITRKSSGLTATRQLRVAEID